MIASDWCDWWLFFYSCKTHIHIFTKQTQKEIIHADVYRLSWLIRGNLSFVFTDVEKSHQITAAEIKDVQSQKMYV